jgi:HAD superfamily hydrolase (TIGR01484 family)
MISKKVVQNILNENKFLIMCDLDGTLLKNDGTISKFSCEIIKAVQAMGHKFVIVTGRPPRVSKQYYSQLKLDSLFVNYNGALITNPGDKFFSPLQFGFSRELIKEIFADLLVVKFLKNVIFESYDGVYFFKKPTTKEEHEALISHFHVHLKPNDSLNIVKPNFSNINTDCFSIVLILNDDVSFPTVFDRIRSIASTLSVQS